MTRNFPVNRDTKTGPFSLVLGGGGARGLAHIGVLKALERNNLSPSLIVGTSIGALIGGMYSQMQSAKEVEDRVRVFLNSDFYKRIGLEEFNDDSRRSASSVWERFTAHLRQRYLFSKSILGSGRFAQKKLLQSIRMLIGEKDIRDSNIRFAAVSCDLNSGEEFVFTSGSIVNAIAASSAVSGVVAPIAVGQELFIDGAVSSTIPVPAARNISKNPIIAIDVRRVLNRSEEYQHGYEVIIRSSEVTSRKLNDIQLQQADIIIKPKVSGFDWNEFHYLDKYISAGEEAVEEHISEIKVGLKKRLFRFFRW